MNDSRLSYGMQTTTQDYFPFGMLMNNRQESVEDYRFGFNGQEMDNEVSGIGNTNTATFCEYDTRLMRRWNLDPVVKQWESPYLCFSGNPIWFSDPNGADTIKDPNGNKQNVGDGYITYEHEGENYLVGDGLEPKIWDPNLDNGSDNLGGYVDYEGEDPGFLVTGYLQYEIRGSLLVTGSFAIGVAMDNNLEAALYYTWSAGCGPTVGYTYGLTSGVMIFGDMNDFEGWGVNAGAFVACPIIAFGCEVNTYWSGEHVNAFGANSTLPIPIISGGYGAGYFTDVSNTTIVMRGNAEEIMREFWARVNKISPDAVRNASTFEGTNYGPWNDFGSK